MIRDKVKRTKLVGRRVLILTKATYAGFYAGHWGYVEDFDGERFYTVGGGSIGDDLHPVFTRDEFRVTRERKEVE